MGVRLPKEARNPVWRDGGGAPCLANPERRSARLRTGYAAQARCPLTAPEGSAGAAQVGLGANPGRVAEIVGKQRRQQFQRLRRFK